MLKWLQWHVFPGQLLKVLATNQSKFLFFLTCKLLLLAWSCKSAFIVSVLCRYVNGINTILKSSIPILGTLLSPIYFQFFLDKVIFEDVQMSLALWLFYSAYLHFGIVWAFSMHNFFAPMPVNWRNLFCIVYALYKMRSVISLT